MVSDLRIPDSGADPQSEADDFFVRFWGVRGSIACAGPDVLRYGGNTACLEIRCGTKRLIFDAGTGLRYLGQSWLADGLISADLFLTHTHFDHICGLPFFRPFFSHDNRFRIWSGHLAGAMRTKQVISEMMMSPLFPVPPEVFCANVSYMDFMPGDVLGPQPDISVRTASLRHPDGATGYRVDFRGRSIAYVTDTEHDPGRPDQAIIDLVAGADIFIYDATYTDDEYTLQAGKGHSTWQEGARLADLAGVRCYVPFHHDPDHDDAFMDKVAEQLSRCCPGSVVAREGLTLRPVRAEKSTVTTMTSVTRSATWT